MEIYHKSKFQCCFGCLIQNKKDEEKKPKNVFA